MEGCADCGQADIDDGTINEGKARSQDGGGEDKRRISRLRTALRRSRDADIASRVDGRAHPNPRLSSPSQSDEVDSGVLSQFIDQHSRVFAVIYRYRDQLHAALPKSLLKRRDQPVSGLHPGTSRVMSERRALDGRLSERRPARGSAWRDSRL